ncbi:hypothetical protein J606_3916 [Acinetobacter baumannii 318814]|uniref:Uncharacterized protein n=1 Tax=Acinetobacter baumannii TaxID=470 RepID=A0A0N9MZ83_ACIBA|nr:hypothetical protein [Acinetobacter baumannii]EXH86450.1 hypothetical protein J606_3916 [Acinetobacter baumannii 318814]
MNLVDLDKPEQIYSKTVSGFAVNILITARIKNFFVIAAP